MIVAVIALRGTLTFWSGNYAGRCPEDVHALHHVASTEV
jgi:hypothetical protein